MAVYKVIKSFTDIQDKNHAYEVGDVFPHDGRVISPDRIRALTTNANRRGTPLITVSGNAKVVKEDEEEKKEESKTEDSKYTKSDINRMPIAKLKEVATDNGIDGVDDKTGGELKKLIIEKLGL